MIPGFRALDKAAVAHAERWRAYCAAPTTTGRAQLVESFHALADRWAAIEIIQHGPGQDDFRNERFFFWPERRNAVARALAAAQSLSAPLGELSAGLDRAQVLRLHGAVDHAADAALAEIPAALGVTVGFNSLDGD